MRKLTKKIWVGNVPVGGDSPITVQSMINTKMTDHDKAIQQINELADNGCDLIRASISSLDEAIAIQTIKKNTSIPFIADIQFDYKLGLAAVENGCDCLRINPGNIGAEHKVREIVHACDHYQIPIRIGVNSGSIHQKFLNQYHGVNVRSLVASAIDEVETLEKYGFYNTKISMKSSNVPMMIDSYTELSKLVDYPLHLGVTEAGPSFKGTIKSSIGIGALLYLGIGDTLRVSLTGDPLEEVRVGKEILQALDIRSYGIDIISCPTCGRTQIDLIGLVEEAERRISPLKKNLKIAIMGCAVNGPGEAREADFGIAAGKNEGILFKKGKIVRKVPEHQLLDALIEMIEEA